MKQYSQIKGLSEARRLPRLGKIRKGIKVASGNSDRPKEVDYFVCPPEVQTIYGEQPKEIDVMLPLDDPNIVFPQSYKLYGSNQKLKCRGDGETALRWTEEGDEEISCPCELLDAKPKQCSQRASLMVMLPNVSMGGCYQIDTGGIHDIININSYIANDGFLRGLAGRIAMVPFKLKRVEAKRDDGTGKMMKHWDIQPVFEGNVDVVNALRGNAQKVLATAATLMIEAPRVSGPETTPALPATAQAQDEDNTPPWEWTPQTPAKMMATIRAIYGYFKWTNDEIKSEMQALFNVTSSKELTAGQVEEWLKQVQVWAKEQPTGGEITTEDLDAQVDASFADPELV